MGVDEEKYIEFPAITIGGGTGDYFATCPVVSCQWAEYAIDTVVNGDGGTGAIVVSGNSKPIALDYTGLTTSQLSDQAVLHAIPIRLSATQTQYVNSDWERLTNSQKKVFVRIDAAASTSMYVTIRFRIRKLGIVPGPAPTVHPDHMQNMNQLRSETTKQRLQELGIPGYAQDDSPEEGR